MKLQKETKTGSSLHGKWYNDACGTAFALEVIGERWALLVVRELMLGGRRFSDLRRSLPGISAKVLTERLETLEKAGVLGKRLAGAPVPARLYELTEWGYHAEPMLQELGRWAARSDLHDPTMPLSPVSLMLSMRTMIDHGKAAAIEGAIGFAVAGERFLGTLQSGQLEIVRRDDLSHADVVFETADAPVLAGVFYGDVPIEQLEQAGVLAVQGDRKLARKFADVLHLPPRIARPA